MLPQSSPSRQTRHASCCIARRPTASPRTLPPDRPAGNRADNEALYSSALAEFARIATVGRTPPPGSDTVEEVDDRAETVRCAVLTTHISALHRCDADDGYRGDAWSRRPHPKSRVTRPSPVTPVRAVHWRRCEAGGPWRAASRCAWAQSSQPSRRSGTYETASSRTWRPHLRWSRGRSHG